MSTANGIPVFDIRPELLRDFERWAQQVGEDRRNDRYAVTATEVLSAHYLLADYFIDAGEGIGGVGPKSLHLLQSAVGRQCVSYGGRQKWNDLFEVAATLFFGLIKNHAFHDANKRTALLVSLYQLQCNKRIVDVAHRELEELAVRVAEGSLEKYSSYRDFRDKPDSEVLFVAKFFRRSTREVDKRELRVTYRQLGAILSRYGFQLVDAHSNRIQIVQEKRSRRFLGLGAERVERVRLATIGFRDWGTEVSGRDLREARRATGLTAENGYDTAVLMQGMSPMAALLSEYSAPLRRLAKK